MTGLTILLFALAGVLLVAAIGAIYAHESPQWGSWWRDDEGVIPTPRPLEEMANMRPSQRGGRSAEDPDEIGVLAGAESAASRHRSFPRDVFKYTIRRPTSAMRKKMPDLGGFSEVPLRLYDQLGNRFTVHQKVRLN